MATRKRKTGSRQGPRDGSSPGPRKKPKSCKK
jgi:hypothetical protein